MKRRGKRKETIVIDPQRELELWKAYLSTKSDADRNRLVELYLPAVRATARVIKSSFAKKSIVLDAEDLVSYGAMGMISAMDRFELDRGLKFLTFAQSRIRGAMIDAVRQQDWVPRAERRARADTPAMLSADLAQDQVDVSVAQADDQLVNLDCQEELDALLASLTPAQRRAFEAYVLEGLEQGPAFVKSRVRPEAAFAVRKMALERLRKFLGVQLSERGLAQEQAQAEQPEHQLSAA
jgi:RNA polymerase sigma factor (sigma-70 family)